jgi:hypothetical protein
MIRLLRALFFLLFAYVGYTVIETSLKSNLFDAWSELASIPWMSATLKDFYALLAPVLLWMFYKERHAAARTIWTILFVCLGSIGTSAYILLQLMAVPADAPLAAVLLRKEETAP